MKQQPRDMDLRDWFAGQALAGLLARGSDLPYDAAADEAYTYAEAMLEVRKEDAAAPADDLDTTDEGGPLH